MARTAIVSYPFFEAIYMGIKTSFELIFLILAAFYQVIAGLFATGKVAADVAGPIGIFVLTGQVSQLGLVYVLQFIALISINLAIINILPFPALDGGRLLFLAIEKIKGKPINQKWEMIIHNTGFALLIILMILITWRDIANYIFK